MSIDRETAFDRFTRRHPLTALLFGAVAFLPAMVGVVLVGVMLVLLLIPSLVLARDDGRYAQSPLKPWFDQLKSGAGALCCSDVDGTAVPDVDWETKDGHYRVRLEGKWWNVPDDAVITEPNRAGRTMVWPVPYYSQGLVERIDIRCFMPGAMI